MVDANVVVSGALREESAPRRALVRAYERGRVALSAAVFLEISEVLTRPKIARFLAPHRSGDIIVALIAQAQLVSTESVHVTDCRDAKDNKYLELALAAAAAAIISGDQDLLVLDPWRGIRILSPADFLVWDA